MYWLLPPAYAAADRLWGSAVPAFRGKKALLILGLLLVGMLSGWPWILAALLWTVYRSLGYPDAPGTKAERIEASSCHFFGGVSIFAVALCTGPENYLLGLSLGVAYFFCRMALTWAYAIRRSSAQAAMEPIGNLNTLIELASGFAYGACLLALRAHL